nr:MAG TPA: hypothetical protein [Caudoviricetes sp.]
MFQYYYVKIYTGIVIEELYSTKRSCPDTGSS